MNISFLHNYRSIGIILLLVFSILLLIFGEKARHNKEVAAEKLASQEKSVKPELAITQDTPISLEDKNKTDEEVNVTGYAVENGDLADTPENQLPQKWQPAGVADKPESLRPAVRKALELQEKTPGRYMSAPPTATGTLFGIDSTSGKVWLLKPGEDNWQSLGSPDGVKKAGNGTYVILSATDERAVVQDTHTALTWQISKDDKGIWTWKTIGGIPSDKSWK